MPKLQRTSARQPIQDRLSLSQDARCPPGVKSLHRRPSVRSAGRWQLPKHSSVGAPRSSLLGSIRETPKGGALLNPTFGSLKRELIERVYIPKGLPNPNSFSLLL